MPQSFLLSACVLLLAASTLPIISYSTSLQPIPISTAISQHRSSPTAPPMAPWSPEEDARLTAMVMKHGAERWSYISTGVPGRTGKSCRRRWCNHLSPAVHNPRAPFTAEEHAFGIRKSQWEAQAGAAAQFAHTNAAASASAAAAAAAAEKGKAVVIDVEEDEAYAGVKVNNEPPPPAKRQRVSNEGGGSASAGGGDADDAWLTLTLGLPQQQQQQQPVEQVITRQAPMAPPVAAETPAVMAGMREMVREEVERQAGQLVASVFMAARAGQL